MWFALFVWQWHRVWVKDHSYFPGGDKSQEQCPLKRCVRLPKLSMASSQPPACITPISKIPSRLKISTWSMSMPHPSSCSRSQQLVKVGPNHDSRPRTCRSRETSCKMGCGNRLFRSQACRKRLTQTCLVKTILNLGNARSCTAQRSSRLMRKLLKSSDTESFKIKLMLLP